MINKIRKALSVLFITGSLMAIHSCSEFQPDFLLKVYVPYDIKDQWIIVSDQNGRLLSYKPASEKGLVVFKGLPSQNVIMTTFRGPELFYLRSIYAIPLGTVIADTVSGYAYQSPPTAKGTASFTIKDFPVTPDNTPGSPTDYMMGAADFGEQYQSVTMFNYGTSLVYDGSTFSFNFTLRNNQSDILGVSYRNGLPVHKWFNGVKPGDMISSSLNDFSLSKTIPINKSAGFNVIGFSGAKSYTLSNQQHWYFSSTTDRSKIPLPGYIDGFDKYSVQISKTDDYPGDQWHWFQYGKLGTLPSSINIPDYSVSIDDRRIDNFSYKFDQDYTYMSAYFGVDGKSSGNVLWVQVAPPNERIVPIQIPGEILSRYPKFNANNLRINMLQFVKENGGDTYLDRIAHLSRQRTTFETVSYQIQYYNY